MKILLVGSGAREHALAWKMSGSRRVDALYYAPGNAGTASCGTNINLKADDVDGIAEFASENTIDLVVVGPELPLSLGLSEKIAQRCPDGRILCFGPSSLAARIESSKAFSKSFMKKYGIPTADFSVFSSYEEAIRFVRDAPWPFVIKASGLASGKGVFLPSSVEEAESILGSLLKEGKLGEAGTEVIIEERLFGEEVSILGFSDGRFVSLMPPAQDHKRLLENNEGPNTGGMGAIASAMQPHFESARQFADLFLGKAVDGMASEGAPFVGVLYAGLILTADGPKALEYNCRFGDPEAEAILPLLKSDIVEIFEACARGRLNEVNILWEEKAAACVVLASEGYAAEVGGDRGREIVDFGAGSPDATLFHGSTRASGGKLYAEGGRLLCASAWADSVGEAVRRAYARIACVSAPRSRYRRDIGSGKAFLGTSVATAAKEARSAGLEASSYASAGVDIDAGDKAVELMSAAVKSTYGPEVIAGIGAFGGMYDASALKSMRDPVLVSSTDGVGTKVKLASLARSYRSIGQDIVNHCIDDILVQGARPLFFLDYIATSKLQPSMIAEAVGGMAKACKESGCALIGGETAEMPGVYISGEFDVAGAIVGVAERDRMLPLQTMRAGDVLVGFPSSGPHTNGYSLIRKIFAEKSFGDYAEVLGMPLIEALLAPHRSYLPLLWPVLQEEPGLIKALAHITGAGFEGNIPRVLPSHLDAHIRTDSWPVPPLFSLIMKEGRIPAEEMFRVFNMGIGMIAAVAPESAETLARLSKGPCFVIGELSPGQGQVIMEWLGARG